MLPYRAVCVCSLFKAFQKQKIKWKRVTANLLAFRRVALLVALVMALLPGYVL